MRLDFVRPNPLQLPAPTVLTRRTGASGMHVWHDWLFMFTISLTLCWMFMLMPLSSALVVGAGVLLGLWGLRAWRNLLVAYGALCFVWLTYYSRTILPIGLIEGAWLRGGVGLGDLLWLVFTGVWLLRGLLKGKVPLPKQLGLPLELPLPFIGLSVFLPILGVLVFGYPWSYIAPGVRHLQWFSFALFTYTLVRSYGGLAVLRTLVITLAISGLLHTSYGLLQLLAFQQVVPAELLLPDLEYLRRFAPEHNKLGLYRATGFAYDPNDLGLWGAIVFQGALALSLVGVPRTRWVQVVGFAYGAFALLFSGSRSALLGSALGLVLQVACLLLVQPAAMHAKLNRLMQLVGAGLVAFAGAALVAATILPYLLWRLSDALAVLESGVATDWSFIGRAIFWENALRAYEERYPFGSWVAATYALQDDIDNYYVFLLVQGTPILLGVFMMVLLGYGWTAVRLVKARMPEEQFVGFAALGVLGVVVGMSVAVNPLLSAVGIVPFWSILGWMAGYWARR